MIKNIETKYTGWAFIFSSFLLWGGWMLLPHHLGQYVQSIDFDEVSKNMWFWIWMYRIHLFGWVGMAGALFSFLSVMRLIVSPRTSSGEETLLRANNTFSSST